MSDRLDAFARRVGDDSAFMASAMQAYARSEGLDSAGLAAFLGCEASQLGRLGLCRRPGGDRLLSDAGAISDRFGLRESALLEIVRRADVLDALRADEAAMLAAARDRTEEDGL